MDKPWLRSYPEGMPEHIGRLADSSLVDFFERIARRHADRPAVANMGVVLNYAQLEERSRYFANYLREGLLLEKGERLAVMLPNILQNPIALWGALRAGLIVVNTNPLYKARELEHQLVDSGASVVVVLENFAGVLMGLLPGLRPKAVITTGFGDQLGFPASGLVNLYVRHVKKLTACPIPHAVPFNRALQEGSRLRYRKTELKADDIALIQYTGGTTGLAKGAMLTHQNLLANTRQSIEWIAHSLAHGKRLVDGEEIVITALPLYHIFALTANLLCFTGLGGLNYLITDPRDMSAFVRDLRKLRFTCITGVNTLFRALLETSGFAQLDFSALKFALGGGMPIQEAVARRWKETTGCALIEGYGLTEASPVVSLNPASLETFNDSIGLPLPSTECSIQDDAGNMLPPGEAGELCVRGPQVMKGYWNQPGETQMVLSPDGWLRTGDIARMDEDGYLYIVDRKKDMILVSGFNVYPNEIEAVLNAHPGVQECAAVGVADPKSGEAVKVFIVRSAPNLDAVTVRQYCRENLTSYKVPKHIEFRDELPKSAIGKILRRKLREG